MDQAELVIIGAGAAGLMAAIWAARTAPHGSVVVLDGAAKLGAKILVSGGGRCNVTHDEVDESAYAGSSRHAIKKVLRRFDVPQTVDFFRELGVDLKREEPGKLFPASDSARTVLTALLDAATRAGAVIRYPRRVQTIRRNEQGFVVSGAWGDLQASKVILATGGKSLPKSGSDGHGYEMARALGHSLTPLILPALVPLTLPHDHFVCTLSGLTLPAALTLHSGTGKQIVTFTGSTLCTHFGLSGPSVLDISRYYLDTTADDPAATLTINWRPGVSPDDIDGELQALNGMSVLRRLTTHLPERLARALCQVAEGAPSVSQLTRQQRKALVTAITALPLPITGNRGYNEAEVTAGGVPLAEIHLESMESRRCPGLYLCGEICDVDGRIGGYNFQWAWASGYVAGVSAARA